jgi:oligopeptide transport system ATP-binding protein
MLQLATAVPDQNLLVIEKLSIGTGRPGPAERLVRDVDLQIRRREALAIVGESGSGKSLTALSIAGMLPASLRVLSGRILFEGKSISSLPEAALHRMRGEEISYVFQDPLSALNPTLTVGKQLVDLLKRHSRGTSAKLKERAAAALTDVGIAHPQSRMRSYPHELSGGMRQRVLIAMAMLCGPKLLIADEPTTALDVTTQAMIIGLFRQIRERGVSLCFISHNLDLVSEFCDRIVVMYGGRVAEVGTASEIAGQSRHPYTKALLECVPKLGRRGERLRTIEGQPPSDLTHAPPCPFADRCPRVQMRCWSETPPFVRASETHFYACWNPIPHVATGM